MQKMLRYITQVCDLAPNAGLYTLVLIRASLDGTKVAGAIADATMNELKACHSTVSVCAATCWGSLGMCAPVQGCARWRSHAPPWMAPR